MVLKMFWRKTKDIIVETATIVKGLKGDFKAHVDDNKNDIEGLYKVIKECHESCPEKERLDTYITVGGETLKRIEDNYDDYHRENQDTKKDIARRQDDYLAKLQTIKDEVKGIKQEKKTFWQVMAGIGKAVTVVILLGGLVVGIIRYCEMKRQGGDVKIEKLLKELIKEQRVEKGDEDEGD